jgi:hypothetical protein
MYNFNAKSDYFNRSDIALVIWSVPTAAELKDPLAFSLATLVTFGVFALLWLALTYVLLT